MRARSDEVKADGEHQIGLARLHQLSGDRVGTWSISASGNWRITFETDGDEIRNLDLEDYH